jgi:transposase InsO family protein
MNRCSDTRVKLAMGRVSGEAEVHCVKQRFGAIRAPHTVQWLSDNGSIFAAHKTIEIALALNLVPCFTQVESPESNGMAEAFVKTFKRDYSGSARSRMPLPRSPSSIAGWRNTTPCTRIPGWATAHPGSICCPNPSRVRFNGVNSTPPSHGARGGKVI